MSVNEKLVREVMTAIRQNPESWDQDTYVRDTECGTAYCFAGWALRLSGYPVRRGHETRHGSSPYFCENDGSESILPHPHVEAAALLGLTRSQSDGIFYFFQHESTSTDADVQEMADHVSRVTGLHDL